MASKPLEPGDPLRLGRFELLARLGQGGQGVVYLGRGPGPGEERVAVKVLRSSVDGMELQRLGRELDAIHQVQPFVTARVIERPGLAYHWLDISGLAQNTAILHKS